jgi:hypothetical protein
MLLGWGRAYALSTDGLAVVRPRAPLRRHQATRINTHLINQRPTNATEESMSTPYALAARIEAKPDRADEVAKLLASALPLAQAESGTLAWYAARTSGRRSGSSTPSAARMPAKPTLTARSPPRSKPTPTSCSPPHPKFSPPTS